MTPTHPYKAFFCDCYTPSHNMIVDASSDYGVVVYVALNKNFTFFGRLKACFMYLFGIGPGNSYWHYETVHLDKARVQDLIDTLSQWQIDFGDVVDTYSEDPDFVSKGPYD